MSLTVSLAFLFVALVMLLLAIVWQLRHVLSAVRDSWEVRPSLFRAAMQFCVGAFMLTTVLMMPYAMLVFAFVYAVIASAILAFGIERLCWAPAIEFIPFWYVGTGGERWEPFKNSLAFPRRVTIRWLVLFLTLFSVSLAVFATKYQSRIRNRQLEQAAVERIKTCGGIVRTTGSFEPFPGRLSARWYDVSFAGSNVTDEDLATLVDLVSNESTVTTLNLGATNITNVGMRHVGKLTTLRSLTLSGTDIDDDGLRHLTQLTGLRTLELRQTKVTGIAFPIIDRLLNVDLSRCEITPAGLAAVARAKTSTLYLNETEIDDAMIKDIERFDSRTIDLTDTKVSRAAASEIRGPYRIILGSLKITPRSNR